MDAKKSTILLNEVKDHELVYYRDAKFCINMAEMEGQAEALKNVENMLTKVEDYTLASLVRDARIEIEATLDRNFKLAMHGLNQPEQV